MLNHIVLMGRLTRDPELRYTQSQIPVASFRLAVDRDFGGRDGGINADAAAAKAANPITYIGKNSAPMLLMHGTGDYIVSPSQTDLLFQALQKADIPSDRYLVEGAAHGGIYWNQAEVLNVITNFFNKYLK